MLDYKRILFCITIFVLSSLLFINGKNIISDVKVEDEIGEDGCDYNNFLWRTLYDGFDYNFYQVL